MKYSERDGLSRLDTAIKSVNGDTPIIININGNFKRVQIGDFIDKLLIEYKNNIEFHSPENANMELLELKNDDIFIQSVNKIGKISWEKISHITRHDPSDLIYCIKTRFGRQVKVVESKSLLVWNGKEFTPKDSKKLVIGDLVPVVSQCSKWNGEPINSIKISDYQ